MLVASLPTIEVTGPIALRPLFDQLDHRGVRYCLLRGLDQLFLDQAVYEVDLLVSASDLALFRDVTMAAGFEPIAAWGSSPHVFFVSRSPHPRSWIKLDVVTDLRYGPRRALRAGRHADCLRRRRLDHGVFTLAAPDEFMHLILHGILDKGAIGRRYQQRLRTLSREIASDPDLLALAEAEFDGWLAPALTYAEAAADCAALDELNLPLSRLLRRRQFVAVSWRGVCSWLARRLRPLELIGRGRGFVVAILGPDGSGKTAVATAMSKSSPLPTRKVYVGYGKCDDTGRAWGRRLRSLANATPPEKPDSIRRIRLGCRWLGRIALQLSRSAVIHARRATGQVVLLDRHVYDFWAGAEQQLSPTRRAMRWCLTAISPTPDLVVVLDAPAETLWKRKPEWPVQTLASKRAGYRGLAEGLPNAVVIDATRELAAVADDVADEIWRRRSPRWARTLVEGHR